MLRLPPIQARIPQPITIRKASLIACIFPFRHSRPRVCRTKARSVSVLPHYIQIAHLFFFSFFPAQ